MTTVSSAATARWATIAGGLALAMAILGALVSFLAAPGMMLTILTIAVWVVAALGVIGVVLALMAGAIGPGRPGLLLSAAALVLLGLFLSYSSFSAPVSGTGGPAASPAPITN